MQDWDRHAIEMLDRCPSEKCFLSHYPPAVGDPGYQIPVLCKSHFDVGAQMPSFEARNFDIAVRHRSLVSAFPFPPCGLLCFMSEVWHTQYEHYRACEAAHRYFPGRQGFHQGPARPYGLSSHELSEDTQSQLPLHLCSEMPCMLRLYPLMLSRSGSLWTAPLWGRASS